MNRTKSSMIDIKSKETIKLDIVELDECKTYSEEELLPVGGLCIYLYEPGEEQYISGVNYVSTRPNCPKAL